MINESGKVNNITILYDYQVFFFQKFGGVSNYFCNLAKEIDSSDIFDVRFFLGFHKNEHAKNAIKYNKYDFGAIPSFPQGRRLSRFANTMYFKNMLSDSSSFRKGRPKIIYHPTYFDDIVPAKNLPRVLTIYDMIPEIYRSKDYSPRKLKPTDTIERKRKAVEKADIIIAISENTKKDIINYYPNVENKIKVIFLGSSLSLKDNSEIKREPRFNVTKPYILYVGWRESYKNFKTLLHVFGSEPKINKNISLLCIGGGPFSKNEHEVISRYGIEGKVSQVDVTDDDLPDVYRHATMLVYTSEYEGFGLPLLDAMKMGCPVLASRSSSIPEVIGDAGMYFDPFSMDDLEDKILQLLENPSLLKNLQLKGFERAKLFSWKKCAEETMGIYSSIFV